MTDGKGGLGLPREEGEGRLGGLEPRDSSAVRRPGPEGQRLRSRAGEVDT